MKHINFKQTGYTLVELMIVVGILGVLGGVAMPAYFSYISTGESAVVATNAETLAGFEDTYFYENGTYLAGTYDPAGTDDLTVPLGWVPSDKGLFRYVVAAGACGNINACYTLTITQIADNTIAYTMNRP